MRPLILALLLLTSITANAQFNFWHGMVGSGEKEWPYGSSGDLVISTLVTVAPGTVWDYKNITITSTGTLRIVGSGGEPVIIGVRGTFINNGVVEGRNGFHNGGTFSATTPGLENISYSISQSVGGAGGQHSRGGGSCGFTGVGGAGTNGFGGGGAVFSFIACSFQSGGAGGGSGLTQPGYTSGTPGAGMATGGAGGNASGINGGTGGGSGGGAGMNVSGTQYPGGGGGGNKGNHGQMMYIKAKVFSGNGSFNFAGTNGFPGGASAQIGTVTAGGGGGGAGGSGGRLLVRFKQNTFSGSVSVGAGSGGSGGASIGGTCNHNQGVRAGCAGSSGNPGANGSSSFIAY